MSLHELEKESWLCLSKNFSLRNDDFFYLAFFHQKWHQTFLWPTFISNLLESKDLKLLAQTAVNLSV